MLALLSSVDVTNLNKNEAPLELSSQLLIEIGLEKGNWKLNSQYEKQCVPVEMMESQNLTFLGAVEGVLS